MDSVHFEGYLVKRTMKSGRNWKRRYFLLKGTKLMYFRSEGDARPRGEIIISSDTFVKASHYKLHSMELSTNRQVLVFCAESDESRSRWLSMLGKSIQLARIEKDQLSNRKSSSIFGNNLAVNSFNSQNSSMGSNTNMREEASASFHEEESKSSASMVVSGGFAGGIANTASGIFQRLKHRRRSSGAMSQSSTGTTATAASSFSQSNQFLVRGDSNASDAASSVGTERAARFSRADTDPWCGPTGSDADGNQEERPIPPRRPTHRFATTATTFEVDTRYSFIRPIGTGAYGVVVSAKDHEGGEEVAIKKVTKAFEDLVDAKRILREVKLLRHFDHENVIHIKDLLAPRSYNDFEDIYIVSELMETDLHRVIYSKQVLTEDHVQYFIYQTLRALKYIHSANVIHRDLKPSNLLLNSNCDLKVCDFGLARGLEDTQLALTEYVVTRWYRAPEIMLSCREYTKSIDVWAVGCIFAELLQRKPLFPGEDYIHQLQLITDVLGTPSESDMDFIRSDRAKRFMRNQPLRCKRRFAQMFPSASHEGLDLLEKMLQFNPAKRITVDQALEHPYLESLHQADDEPVCENLFLFDDNKPDDQLNKRDIQDQILLEMLEFHPEDRARVEAQAKLSRTRSQYI